MAIVYDYPLYRPPSEADSIILQVTLGCSFNKCSFCNMYRTKQYSERPLDEVKSEIDIISASDFSSPRVFLADGDALNLATGNLVEILRYIRAKLPGTSRISCYAMPKNLIQKSLSDLEILRKEGLDMLYVGIESGNDAVLRKVTKGASSGTIIEACRKARDSGFIISCMVILGLGGKSYSKEHIADTARVLSAASPDFAAALSLHLDENVHPEFMEKFGEPFEPLDDDELLDELERLVSDTTPGRPMVFRANHASNVYSVGGTLPQDRSKMLEIIRSVKLNPEKWKPRYLRGF